MKRLIVLTITFFLAASGRAQTDTSVLYLRFPTVPPFSITRVTDSTKFTKNDLLKKKATIIIIFSPDCEHCQKVTRELVANIKLFKKAQIIMASPLEHKYLKKFYKEYNIASCPNIIMGRDPGYFFGSFYRLRFFPGIFLYDKKGNFVKAFDGNIPVEKIAEAL